jgi:hypothetical protein
MMGATTTPDFIWLPTCTVKVPLVEPGSGFTLTLTQTSPRLFGSPTIAKLMLFLVKPLSMTIRGPLRFATGFPPIAFEGG